MDASVYTVPALGPLRKRLDDLFAPQRWLYWSDFLVSAGVGWTAFALAFAWREDRLVWLVLTALAAVALYRAVVFTHELTHRKHGDLPGFAPVWNLLCGIPLMVPSFMYRGVHSAHHVKAQYGTRADGEYLPFAARHPLHIVGHLASNLLLPLLAAVRFVVLAPLSLLHPRLRRLLMERGSSLAIDAAYVRPLPNGRDRIDWYWQEATASLFGIGVIALVVMGELPAVLLWQWYAVTVLILVMNALRTLGAHRYRNRGDSMSLSDQIHDSLNITGQPLLMTVLAPLGMRYHALHHLFPTLPYHSLGAAHRRLMRQPDNGWYRATVRASLWHSVGELWRTARSAAH
jgi:fatty acid desaturase